MSDKINYLNVGCGSRYHPSWINMDIAPQGPDVIQIDLRRGIPLPDVYCDAVYHSAVLEHMRRADAIYFLTECYRVLKPNGIIRVGIPDLEKICQLYLSSLDGALTGDIAAEKDYDWIMLELFDQVVRESSGGDMLHYMQQSPLENEAFVFERIGEEGRHLIQSLQQQSAIGNSLLRVFRKFRKGFRYFPNVLKRYLPLLVLSEADRKALKIGRFRLEGEVHQWMYDRFSLARLLIHTGFHEPIMVDAVTSKIPNWINYHLDTLPDGKVIKPDLLFMEAIKP